MRNFTLHWTSSVDQRGEWSLQRLSYEHQEEECKILKKKKKKNHFALDLISGSRPFCEHQKPRVKNILKENFHLALDLNLTSGPKKEMEPSMISCE